MDKRKKLMLIRTANRTFDMKALLLSAGHRLGSRQTMLYCPFHDDKDTEHKSAKFFADSNTIHCFSEGKNYGPYDALSMLMGFSDEKILTALKKQGIPLTDELGHSVEIPTVFIKDFDVSPLRHNFILGKASYPETVNAAIAGIRRRADEE